VLIVDDLLATGGTLQASAKLAAMAGASIIGATVLIELQGLRGRDKLGDIEPLHCVLRF